MCMAVPLQVVRMEGPALAWCRDGTGALQRIDTLLTGPLEPDQWLLGYLGAARETIDAERAAQVAAALEALAALDPARNDSGGGTAPLATEMLIRAGFADLVDREPQLPAHLRSPLATEST